MVSVTVFPKPKKHVSLNLHKVTTNLFFTITFLTFSTNTFLIWFFFQLRCTVLISTHKEKLQWETSKLYGPLQAHISVITLSHITRHSFTQSMHHSQHFNRHTPLLESGCYKATLLLVTLHLHRRTALGKLKSIQPMRRKMTRQI